MKQKKAVFLDRDGVLLQVVMRQGVTSSARKLEEVFFIEESRDGLDRLKKAGFLLFVFTNQPDVSRKNLSLDVLNEIHHHLAEWCGDEVIQQIYFCPHDQDDGCDCRKPESGMLKKAENEWGIRLDKSYVIGDREVDILAGKNVGCVGIILDAEYNRGVASDYRAKNMSDAVNWILRGKHAE